MTGARPGLVIFDCDGVIVDSEPIASRVVASALTRAGWPVDADEANTLFVGGTMRGICETARARGLDLPDDWVDGVYAEMFAALAETPPVPGVIAVLDALDSAGAPYCLGSNGPQAKMDVTLAAAGVAACFEGRRFSATEVARPKPAPDLFLHAAAKMGASIERCVVVGDTLNDAKAARAAGMLCFGYASETPPEAFSAEGARPFRDMSELPGLLGL